MRRSLAVLPLLSLLVFTGQGCTAIGSKQTASATDGGVFRTGNAGDTWTQLVALPTAKGVGSLAGANVVALEADPQDPLVFYAGTRENGLAYTVDGGVSWLRPRLEALRDGLVADVEVDPKSTCTAYVVKGSRLYKTVDCARSFDQDVFVETRANVQITDLALDWYAPKTLWLGESNGDLQKSEDGGKTWRRALDNRSGVTSILVAASDSRVVIVGTKGAGFFRTGNSGASWTQTKEELKKTRGADTVLALSQDAKGKTVVAATDYGLLRSLDAGATWEPMQLLTTAGQVQIRALAVGPEKADTIAYAVGGTFYRSVDGGKNWTTHKLPSTRDPLRLLPDLSSADAYFLGFAAPLKK